MYKLPFLIPLYTNFSFSTHYSLIPACYLCKKVFFLPSYTQIHTLFLTFHSHFVYKTTFQDILYTNISSILAIPILLTQHYFYLRKNSLFIPHFMNTPTIHICQKTPALNYFKAGVFHFFSLLYYFLI